MAGSGNNFVANPGGTQTKKGGGQPESYGVSRPQQSGKSYDLNGADAADGPPTAAEVATPSQDAGNPLGTIADRAVHKPFKVSGA